MQRPLHEFLKRAQAALDDLYFTEGVLALSCYGNSLGQARGGSFIPWDTDLDVMVREEVPLPVLERVAARHRGRVGSFGQWGITPLFYKIKLGDFDIDFFPWEQIQQYAHSRSLPLSAISADDAFSRWHYRTDPVYGCTLRYSQIDAALSGAYYAPSDLTRWVFGGTPPIVVGVDGCFDILHAGHIDFINRAAAVAPGCHVRAFIPSDALMDTYKPGKRVRRASERSDSLLALRNVHSVVVLNDWLDLAEHTYLDKMVACTVYRDTAAQWGYDQLGDRMVWQAPSSVPIHSSDLR